MLKRTKLMSVAIALAGALAMSANAADRPKAKPGAPNEESSGAQSPKDLGDTKNRTKMARPKSKAGAANEESSGAQSPKDLGDTKNRAKQPRPKSKTGQKGGDD